MDKTLPFQALLLDGPEARTMARFRTLEDAMRYVRIHSGQGVWDIELPDGRRLGSRATVPVAPAAREEALRRKTKPYPPARARDPFEQHAKRQNPTRPDLPATQVEKD